MSKLSISRNIRVSSRAKCLGLLLLGTLLFTPSSSAQTVLLEWTFNEAATTTQFNPVSFDSNISGSQISFNGLTEFVSGNAILGSGWTASDSLSFDVTVATGLLHISKIEYAINSVFAGTPTATLDVTIGGITSNLDSITFPGAETIENIERSIGPDGSTMAFIDGDIIDMVNGTITFTLSGLSDFAGGFGSLSNLGGVDIRITGTLSNVPEPSTYAIFSGIIVLGFVINRRRKSLV